MVSGGARVPVNAFPIPIALMVLVTTPLFFLKIAGTKTSRQLGARFISKGVVAILPFVLVFLMAGLVIPALAGSAPGGDQGAVGAQAFLAPIAKSPFGGATTISLQGNSANLVWGLALGAWLLIASAAAMFLAGALAISQTYQFFPRFGPEGYPGVREAPPGPPQYPPGPPLYPGRPPQQ
jgi:hypothetical protein